MSDIYKKKNVAENFDFARSMPDETLAFWMDTLRKTVPALNVEKILDLGGGTGRFAGALQRAYNCHVIVFDPAEEMLDQGRKRGFWNTSWVCGVGEDIPLETGEIDIVWMSNAFHHLDNKSRTLKEVYRVLKPQGFLAIRNGTRETDAEIKWMDLVPEVRQSENYNIPHRIDIINEVLSNGFSLVKTEVVYQKFASTYLEYYEKISRRGLSLLISISDEAFNRGMANVRKWIDTQPRDQPVYEPIDFFVFHKP